MTWVLLMAALSMGFFGSPHCLGMCGGIVTAFGLSMQSVSPQKQRQLVLTYHLGRLISYALLGLLAGLVGTTVLAPLMHNSMPRILLGLALVLVGLTMFGLPILNQLEKLGMRFWQALAPLRKKVFPMDSFGKAIIAGLLWGFLPCGLVYSGLMLAVVGHDIPTASMMMFVFGLGTLPMLLATQTTIATLQNLMGKFRLRQLNASLLIIAGLVILVPKMLGVEHSHESNMSPDAMTEMSQHHHEQTLPMPTDNPQNHMSHHEHPTQ